MWSHIVCMFAISQAALHTIVLTAENGREVIIESTPSTMPVTLGSTVYLVCKTSSAGSDSSNLTYQWSCPNGPCVPSMYSNDMPRSMSQNGNILTVTVITERDAGQYTCTASDGVASDSATHQMSVAGGIVAYNQPRGQPLMVHTNGKVITSMDEMASGFFDMVITCRGPGNSRALWKDQNNNFIPSGFTRALIQDRGNFMLKLDYSYLYQDGRFTCFVGSTSLTLGLYLRIGGIRGQPVTGLRPAVSCNSARLEWKKFPTSRNFKPKGFYVSYGGVGHDVNENVILNGASTTSVDLTNLQPGVEYEATVRAFGESKGQHVISPPSRRLRWTKSILPSAPLAPTNLSTTCLNSSAVLIEWTQPSQPCAAPIAAYIISYHSVNGSGNPLLKSVYSLTTSIILQMNQLQLSIVKLTEVMYEIRAIDSQGTQSMAAEGTITLYPPIGNLTFYLNNCTLSVSWTMYEGLNYTCTVDGQPITECISPFSVNTNKTHCPEVTVSSWKGASKIESVTQVLLKECKDSGMSRLTTNYGESGIMVSLSWTLFGHVDKVLCRLNNESAQPCSSPLEYDSSSLPAGKHVLEVIPFCGSIQLRSRTKDFRSRSGISDDANCDDLEIQNVTLRSFKKSAVYLDFSTSTLADCVCRIEGVPGNNANIRIDPCYPGKQLMKISPAEQTEYQQAKPVVVVTCRSSDCNIVHRIQTVMDFNKILGISA